MEVELHVCYDYELQHFVPVSLYVVLCGILFRIYTYKVLKYI
jgi:hypothetical protein